MENKTQQQQEEEIINNLIGLIKKGEVLTTGHYVFLASGRDQAKPIGMFTRHKDSDEVFFSTPEGLELFPAEQFFEFCKEDARKKYLENVEKMIRKKKALVGDISNDSTH